jgi:hypothetical protein
LQFSLHFDKTFQVIFNWMEWKKDEISLRLMDQTKWAFFSVKKSIKITFSEIWKQQFLFPVCWFYCRFSMRISRKFVWYFSYFLHSLKKKKILWIFIGSEVIFLLDGFSLISLKAWWGRPFLNWVIPAKMCSPFKRPSQIRTQD